MDGASTSADADFHQTASDKLVKVLGPSRGPAVFTAALRTLEMSRISSADDLFRFGQHLETQGSFTATVGALLCLTAVMAGASGRAR